MARQHRYAKRCGREYWSVGVLRPVRIAPRGRGVGDAEGRAKIGKIAIALSNYLNSAITEHPSEA
jgi:hypothetical protein